MARTRTRSRGHQRRWYQRRWLWSLIVVVVVSGVGWWSWEQYSGQQQSRAAEGARAPAFMLPSYVLIDAHGRVRARAVDPYFGVHSEAILQHVAHMGTAAVTP